MIDFHTHILPGMDDGSRDLEESMAMLRMSEAGGVIKLVATPHFRAAEETVEQFLYRRREAFTLLKEAMAKEGSKAAILLGAEVALFPGLVDVADLEKLALGKSSYILIEMPMGQWSKSTYVALYAIMLKTGLTPVIAHIDRYLKGKEQEDAVKIKELLDMGAVLQMNTSYLLHFFTKRKAGALIRQNVVSLLGSDCHNVTTRPPDLPLAWKTAKRLSGESRLSEIWQMGHKIFESTQEDS